MDETNYIYDGKFEGNILIVGRTWCGKTTFAQNFVKNRLFVNIKEVYWISKIVLTEDREENIRDFFLDQVATFDYPKNMDEFDEIRNL